MSNIADINLTPFLDPKFDGKAFAVLEKAKATRVPVTAEHLSVLENTPEMSFPKPTSLSETELAQLRHGLNVARKLSPNSNTLQVHFTNV